MIRNRWFCWCLRQITGNIKLLMPDVFTVFLNKDDDEHPGLSLKSSSCWVYASRWVTEQLAVTDPGEGCPPLIFRPNWGPKGRKKFVLRLPLPLISGSGWLRPPLPPPPPTLSEGLDAPLARKFFWPPFPFVCRPLLLVTALVTPVIDINTMLPNPLWCLHSLLNNGLV